MEDILIIDDDPNFREIASLVLEEKGYRVREASCSDEAFALLIAGERFDVILCDLYMPFTNGERQEDYQFSVNVGYRTAKELAWALPQSKVIVLSSFPPSDMQRLARHLDPIQAFAKPTTTRDLIALLDDAAMMQ